MPDTPPDPRTIFSFVASAVILLVAFWLLGVFGPGGIEALPEWVQLGWGLSMVVVFAYMAKTDMFNAEIGDFMVVAYGPGTILTWLFYWISLSIFPPQKHDPKAKTNDADSG